MIKTVPESSTFSFWPKYLMRLVNIPDFSPVFPIVGLVVFSILLKEYRIYERFAILLFFLQYTPIFVGENFFVTAKYLKFTTFLFATNKHE